MDNNLKTTPIALIKSYGFILACGGNFVLKAIHVYRIKGKFRPRFIFAIFGVLSEGKFKTGHIELCIKDIM